MAEAPRVVVPTWLTSRDDVWLRELAAEAAASDGRRVDIADERILEVVAPIARRHGAARRVVEAVWFVERRRWKTRVDSKVPPERMRRVLFDLAAEREREEALATAANGLGIDVAAIASSLFADRARARSWSRLKHHARRRTWGPRTISLSCKHCSVERSM